MGVLERRLGADTGDGEDGGEAAPDATPSDTDGGVAKSDAGAEAGSAGCANETEPNDGVAQQMPRSLCGTLTAGDRDRFYIEGRQDEPIEVIFSAYFGKSFRTTVKPGDRKLFIEVGLAKAPVAYHFAFERR